MAQPRKLHDKYFKQAKAEGYAARSAYKLLEIVKRRRVIKAGDRVLDLGCAPGSWLQVASEIVGPKGLVVGLDLKPVEIPLAKHAHAMVGDAFKSTAVELLAAAGERADRQRLFDAVISDMAPNTEGGGGGSADHFRSVELCRRVLELLPAVLRPGGDCVMKVFEGEAYPVLLRETGRLFKEVRGFKPAASRDVSREMFIIASAYKGPRTPAPSAPLPHAIARAAPAPLPGWGTAATGGGRA